jgi:23S rRNA pseudouridine2605 synthase
MQERIQKILSQWGIASRRQAEQMILDGRVCLNGAIAQLGQKADPVHDRIVVDGRPVRSRPPLSYFLVNKPIGVVSTCSDPQNRTTVLQLLPKDLRQGQGLHPVGRLDIDSTGALLLTNDGELTNQLTHPRHHIEKTYQVWVNGCPSESVLRQWREGIILDGQKTLPATVKVLKQSATQTLLQVILQEGRNRQIRRVAEQLNHPVLRLHRSAIGSIQLHLSTGIALALGHYRPLEEFEIQALKQLTSYRAVASR